jgi:hypothetical protein
MVMGTKFLCLYKREREREKEMIENLLTLFPTLTLTLTTGVAKKLLSVISASGHLDIKNWITFLDRLPSLSTIRVRFRVGVKVGLGLTLFLILTLY